VKRRLPLLMVLLAPLDGQSLPACQNLLHHGKLQEAKACFARLANSSDPSVKAEGLWGAGQYKEANDEFRLALKQHPESAEVRVRWGRLFLERFNKSEAGGLFQEALAKDPKNAQALLGMALLASEGFSHDAVELAQKAVDADPKLTEAHELLAYLALEDNEPEKAAKEADKALAISSEALDALAIHATIDWLDDKTSTPWFEKITAINPAYGEAQSTAGHFFVINRRYREGVAHYRSAIQMNPQLWQAHSELGVNLIRLGQFDEGSKELEAAYNGGFKTTETVNALRLLDKFPNKDYVTYKTPTTILRLEKKEAELLKPYIEAELQRAIATYDKKYQMKLAGPVELDVFPNHEDFSVFTAAMPGLGSILGVTFGLNFAMDSPSGRSPGSFHWASTLWHELSHVYVLQATQHRVPRWFTEGFAVYEETAASPDWGDRLDPEVINAIKENKLLPIAELDRGFLRPSYPMQVIVSYYQAGKICNFIAEKRGYQKLLDMMHAYARLEPTPDVVKKELSMSPEEFDKQFLAWLHVQTKAPVEHFADWKKGLKQMHEDMRAKKYDAVLEQGQVIHDYFLDYVEPGSVYELMADAYVAKGDKPAARKQLEQWSAVGGRSPLLIKKLATLEEEAGDPKKAAAVLNRLNYIYPEDEELHHRLGDLWLAQNNIAGAIREYQAVVALKPLDQATSHFQLAKAYKAASRAEDARDQVLLSLEAAPGYKPAQQLLLELSK
jgi:tetratricopeptide (TPR) repeat protein